MNSREIALNIVSRVLDEGAYSNLVLSKELNESNLDDKDRALVTELVYGTIRRKNTLDTIISNFVKDIKLMDLTVGRSGHINTWKFGFFEECARMSGNTFKDEDYTIIEGYRIDKAQYKRNKHLFDDYIKEH